MASAAETAATIERREARTRWLLLAPTVVVLTLAAVGPLFIMLAYSFLEKNPYGGVLPGFSLDGWTAVFLERDIFDNTLSFADAHVSILWRTIKLSFWTTVLCLIFGFPTAYFIATRSEKWRDVWLFLITIPFWTNLLIRTFAIQELIRNEGVVNSLLMWTGIIDQPLQIMFTDFAIMLGMVYVYLPLMVLPLYASLEKLDFRLVEAGYDLYANRLKVLWRIILPLVRPGIIAGSILVFIPSLGAYVTPRVLGGGKNLMVGNLIELQFGQGRNWPLGSALSIALMMLVMAALLVYVRQAAKSGQRHG
jgi:spermidine/putrescine transport system permease protein